MILETTFLVDLDREISRGTTGPAQEFLERHAEERLYITPTIAGELAAGPRVDDREAWEGLIAPFRILEVNRDGQLFGILRKELPVELLSKMHSVAFSDGIPPRARVYADMVLEALSLSSTQEVTA